MTENQIPLARHYNLEELPGKKSRQLDVPPGRLGVVITADGALQTYQPGQHTLAAGGRGSEVAAGMKVGFVPAAGFNARLKAENLLSRDSALLDASLLCAVEIFDLAGFFTQYVVPRGVIHGDVMDLPAQSAWDILAPGVRRNLAVDLLAGRHGDALMADIRPGLEPALNQLGLHLDFFHFISFLRSEDRLIAAEQALALEQRLQDVENRRKITAAKSRQDLTDALSEMGIHEEQSVTVHPLHDPEPSADALQPTFLSGLTAWVSDLGNKETRRDHFRLGNLFQRKDKAKTQTTLAPRRGRRYPRYWWRRHVIWMVFVLLLAIGLTKVVNFLAGDADGSNRWEFYFIVWGAVAGILFDSIKKLFQKYDELQHAYWVDPGTTFVDDLVGQDRAQADVLVRDQTHNDLQTAQSALNDLRSRVFAQGEENLALELRALEKEFANAREMVMNPNLGVPPYVTDLKINRKLWDDLLDYDEGLLVRSSALGEDVQSLVQESTRGQIGPDKLNQLRASLDALKHHFANRSQALKISEEQKKRLQS